MMGHAPEMLAVRIHIDLSSVERTHRDQDISDLKVLLRRAGITISSRKIDYKTHSIVARKRVFRQKTLISELEGICARHAFTSKSLFSFTSI